MATSVSFSTASPHSLTALITSDDGTPVSVARATVLAACSEGPLKALLTRVTDWTVFNSAGARCADVVVRELINRGAGAQAETLEVLWEAAALKCDCDANLFEQIEIRLPHSERF
jgi:hypothetical protein